MPKAAPAHGPAPGQTAASGLIARPRAEVLEPQELPAPTALCPLPPPAWYQPDFSRGVGHFIHSWLPASLTALAGFAFKPYSKLA